MKKLLSLLNNNRHSGQGMIEYAGSMVIAALVVATVIPITTTGMTNLYQTLFTGMDNFVSHQMVLLNKPGTVNVDSL